MTEELLLSIFIVIVGIWLASFKVYQLIAKTFIAPNIESEGPFIFWANHVWAVLGMMGGFLGVIFGIWALRQTLNARFQGVVPDVIFYLVYVIALGGVYWLAKNHYKKAMVYTSMLTIYLVLTVLFSVFGSGAISFKLGTIFVMLLIYTTFSMIFILRFAPLK